MKKKRKDAQTKTWQWNDQDLQQSLELWADLEHLKGCKSPEEKLLEDFRHLLTDLKKDMQVFENK